MLSPFIFVHSVTSYESASSRGVGEHGWSGVGGVYDPHRLSHHICSHNPRWSPTRDQSPRKRYQHHHQRVGARPGVQHQRVRCHWQHHQRTYEHHRLHLWVHFSAAKSLFYSNQHQIMFFSWDCRNTWHRCLIPLFHCTVGAPLHKHDTGLIKLHERFSTISRFLSHLSALIFHIASSDEQLAVFANRIWLDTYHLLGSTARLAKC